MSSVSPSEATQLDALARALHGALHLDPITRRAVEAGYIAGRVAGPGPEDLTPSERRTLNALASATCHGYAPTPAVRRAVLAGYALGRDAPSTAPDTPSLTSDQAVVTDVYRSDVAGAWIVAARCPEGWPVHHGGGSGPRFDPGFLGPRVSHCGGRRPTRDHPACAHDDYVLTLPEETR